MMKWRIHLAGAACLVVLCFALTASPGSPKVRGPYLGQDPPGMVPRVFAPGFISTAAYEFAGTFSPDGLEYYYTYRPNNRGSKNRIYCTSGRSGEWTRPAMASFAADLFEFLPHISPDGQTLFFCSTREKPKGVTGDGEVWFMTRRGNKWSSPRYLGAAAEIRYAMYPTSSMNGNLYLSGIYRGKRGIYRLVHNGKAYSDPEIVLCCPGGAHPFIATDESYLIYDAQPSGRGKPELFVVFRVGENIWSDPVTLGLEINKTRTEFGASVSPDGKYLFFHRRVKGNGDIYWVSAAILEKLKPDSHETP